ncbi:MAG TPA: PaaI family thioesterase [Bacillota bacterium]|nr:PaaI family thioesterase [Bacillota bacterium]
MNKEIARQKFENALESCENSFEKFFLSRFFDLSFSYTEDTCTVEFLVEEYMYNPQGTLHGGVISFILDVSMGHLCKKVLGTAVTLEMKTQYLRPIRSGKARCQASFLKKGRTVLSIESRLWDEHGELAAMATATWMRV